MEELIRKLEAASEGSRAVWCGRCGRVSLTPPGRKGHMMLASEVEVLAAGSAVCGGTMAGGSPQECIAALTARPPMCRGAAPVRS